MLGSWQMPSNGRCPPPRESSAPAEPAADRNRVARRRAQDPAAACFRQCHQAGASRRQSCPATRIETARPTEAARSALVLAPDARCRRHPPCHNLGTGTVCVCRLVSADCRPRRPQTDRDPGKPEAIGNATPIRGRLRPSPVEFWNTIGAQVEVCAAGGMMLEVETL